MAPALLSAAVFAGLGVAGAADLPAILDDGQTLAADMPIIELDMYRAMNAGGVGEDENTEENYNLADIAGVIKYIMTEVIPEHANDKHRMFRKDKIDSIVRQRFKVRNQPIEQGSKLGPEFIDFGPYVTFEHGQSTNPDLDSAFTDESGDWVGVQEFNSLNPKVPFAVGMQDPLFLYSIGGFCPNLPWQQLPLPDGSTTARCKDSPDDFCQPKGSRKEVNPKCWLNDGKPVMGGLCESGYDENNVVPKTNPTGERGCVYTYGKARSVQLDELVGITAMDCGGHKCTDWWDFRTNCTDKSLQRMYKLGGEGVIIDLVDPSTLMPMCTEYDVHPECQNDCSNPKCLGDYEIGIPFWKNRCDPVANRRRAEILAEALGIEDARTSHQVIADDIRKLDTTCTQVDESCTPLNVNGATSGGPYCSRQFAGVCNACYIRGVSVESDPTSSTKPDCPYDILKGTDYGPSSETSPAPPQCKTKKAGDSCCLYAVDGCEGSDDPEKASIDIDGLALIAYRCYKESTSEHMVTFAGRVAQDLGGKLGTSKDVGAWAYDQWGTAPMYTNNGEKHHKTFEDFQTIVKSLMSPTPSPEPSPPSPGPSPPSAGPSPPPSPGPSGGSSGGHIGLIILVALAVFVVVGIVGCLFCADRPAARHAVADPQDMIEAREYQRSP